MKIFLRATPGPHFGLAFALAAILYTASANADVVLTGDATRIDKTKLDGLVQLELGSTTDVDTIAIDVSGESARVALRRRRGTSRTGSVDLPTGNATDVERTLALFVGELSREPEPEPPQSPPAAPPAPSTTPERPVKKPIATPKTAPAVLAGTTLRVFTADGALFRGAFLGGLLAVDKRVDLGINARYAIASTDVPLGTVKARIVSGGFTGAYRLVEKESFAIHAGVGVELGWVEGSGEGALAHTATTIAVDTRAFLEARHSISGRLFGTLTFDGGALFPGLDLRAGDRLVLAASGPFASVSLGLGFAP